MFILSLQRGHQVVVEKVLAEFPTWVDCVSEEGAVYCHDRPIYHTLQNRRDSLTMLLIEKYHVSIATKCVYV